MSASKKRSKKTPPPREEFELRRQRGRLARAEVPRRRHAVWEPAPDRPDPVDLLAEQAASRVPELVPIRYGRMLVSPFTFYRGAALLMASDLSTTPNSAISVQLCGDAHLSNFGLFGTPERDLVFDINDFDETLPGPWEWDVKRLAASFEIAGRYRNFAPDEIRALTTAAVRGYREQMRAAATSGVLSAWYDHLDAATIEAWVQSEATNTATPIRERQVKKVAEAVAKARTKDSMATFAKLVTVVDGQLRITGDAPLIVPIEDLMDPDDQRVNEDSMRELLQSYKTTLLHRYHPIGEFTYVHMARKVVGVGSVGTRAWVLLLTGRDDDDPLLLQAKEAQASVLERFLEPSEYENHGQRVVMGQRVMQSASDIFLGWQRVLGLDGETRDFYIRQLHDWKGSIDFDVIRASGAVLYAQMCGETLARAHARSGDRVAIAAYMGKGPEFDEAIADFSEAYADQNQRDYDAFVDAVNSGRLEAVTGL